MIAFAVIMSKVGGSILGGIFASFPAVFISTLVISATVVDVDFWQTIQSEVVVFFYRVGGADF